MKKMMSIVSKLSAVALLAMMVSCHGNTNRNNGEDQGRGRHGHERVEHKHKPGEQRRPGDKHRPGDDRGPKFKVKEYGQRPNCDNRECNDSTRRPRGPHAAQPFKSLKAGERVPMLPPNFKTIHVGNTEYYLTPKNKFKAVIVNDSLLFEVMK